VRILLVEDDIRLAQALSKILEKNNYEVDAVHDGQSGLDWGLADIYDVIILDAMLPKMDGFTIASKLRRANINAPIMMLTARSEVADKITGLDSGADDYMTKPFATAELLAHLRALTRRKGDVIFEELNYGDLTLNLSSYDLYCGKKNIHLSYKEFSLLKVLMTNPGQIISKELLIQKVWGTYSDVEENNVEAYVSFVRKKLNYLKSNVEIETVRKAGYRLVEKQSS
jgi:two-component system, OmpR family, response regulator